MKRAGAIGLLLVVLVMTSGVAGVALADRSLPFEHATPFASISAADIQTDDRIISGETVDGDVETDGNIVVTDGSRIQGDVEAGGVATIIDSRVEGDVEAEEGVSVEGSTVDGDVEAEADVTVEGSTVHDDVGAEGDVSVEGSTVEGDVEGDGNVVVTDGNSIAGDVEAGGDVTIIDSSVGGDVGAEGSAMISAGIINEDIDAEGSVELSDGSRIMGDVDAGGDVVISEFSEVDGDIDADGDVIYEEEEATPELSALNIAGQGAEATITEGDDEDVSVVVENVGDADGAFEVTVSVGDWTDTQTTGTIAAGDSETVIFEGGTGDFPPGEYVVTASTGNETLTGDLTVQAGEEPASFEVGITGTNSAVTAGETLMVDVNITNIGAEEGTQPVELEVETLGTVSESVTLGGGVSSTERFAIDTGSDDAGEHTVTVRTDDDSDSAQVTVERARAESDLSGLDIAGQGAQATIPIGEDGDVSVTVENVGDAPGSFDVTLAIDDTLGVSEDTDELAAGDTETITFPDVTSGLVADGYTVDVSTANDSVSGMLEIQTDEQEGNRGDDEQEDDPEDDQQEDDQEDDQQGDDQEDDQQGDDQEDDQQGDDQEADEQEDEDEDDEREGTFETSMASLSNTMITAGESLEIGLQVENVGEGDGTFDADLLVDGETVDSESLTIEAGGTETITFSYQFDEPGEYEIAVGDRPLETVTVTSADEDESEMERSGDDATAIEIVQATVPADWVTDGYETSVRVTVENTANRTANRTLRVTVDDKPVTNETVTLQPLERDEVTIEFEATSGSVSVEDVDAGWIDTSETTAEDETADGDIEELSGLGFTVGIAVLLVIFGTVLRLAVLKIW